MMQAADSTIDRPGGHCLPGTGEIAQVRARLVAAERALAEVRSLTTGPDPILDPEIMVDLAAATQSLQAARRAVEIEMALLGRQVSLPLGGLPQ